MQLDYDVSPEGVVTLTGPHVSDPVYQGVRGWRRYYAGLDLGQARDPSAVVILEDECLPLPTYDRRGRQNLSDRVLTVVHAERLAARRYTALAVFTGSLMQRSPLCGRASLAIDATGVGRAFSDVLDDAGVVHMAVQMTAGTSTNRNGKYWNVSKLSLLSDLAAQIETGQLRIAGDLEMAEELKRELASFQVTHTAAGNSIVEATARGHHGDMVVGLSLALFASSHRPQEMGVHRLAGMW